MGYAKQRGTYEERRVEAIRLQEMAAGSLRPQTSPKYLWLMAAILAQMLPPNPTAIPEESKT